MKNIELYTENDEQFYSTPENLIDEMLEGLDFDMITTILEPSAGKGNIVESILKRQSIKYSYSRQSIDIDCIELDGNLQSILRDKCRVLNKEYNDRTQLVWNDFLTYKPYKQYDLIIMNPPFSKGAEHLLKAIDLQKNGGAIVCILNAETIKNPYTNIRKELIKQFDKYNAKITYIDNAFISAERKTAVEIALVKIYIEPKPSDSHIYDKFEKAAQYEEIHDETGSEIIIDDYIKKAIQLYNIEVKACLQLIKDYEALKPHINIVLNPKENYESEPLIELKLGRYTHKENSKCGINEVLKCIRLKYWKGLFDNPKFMNKLTSNLQSEYRNQITELQNYEFNEYNINNLIIEMNASIMQGVQETIISMFDKLTTEHTWYPECKKNVHYYNGWKTNIAHKVNYKVIVPCNVFAFFDREFQHYLALDVLQDIEKVLNYFDGNMTAPVDLSFVLKAAKHDPKNIECKFFKATFYKKGTCHITFTNQALIDKFNIYVGKNKNWLPPCYGTKPYNNMTDEEKSVIDDFQGMENYNNVMANKQYYLGMPDLIRIA